MAGPENSTTKRQVDRRKAYGFFFFYVNTSTCTQKLSHKINGDKEKGQARELTHHRNEVRNCGNKRKEERVGSRGTNRGTVTRKGERGHVGKTRGRCGLF